MKKLLSLILCLSLLISGCSIVSNEEVSSIDKNEETTSIYNNKETSSTNNEEETISEVNKYSGYICGLIENDNGSDVVIINHKTKKIEKIKYIHDLSSKQTVAVSPNGKKIAYSQYITNNGNDGTCIIVENLINGDIKTFLKEPKEQIIEYMQWLPDNENLTYSVQQPCDIFFEYSVLTINTQMGNQKLLDKGIFQKRLTKQQLDEQMKKYKSNIIIPLEESGDYNYTELKNPTISPDGKKVLYTASLGRNTTPGYDSDIAYLEEPQLWLLSGLFIADITGEAPPKLIYSNPDSRTNVGRAVWSDDSKSIYFSRYYCGFNKGDCGIEKLNLETQQVTNLLIQDDNMRTNVIRTSFDSTYIIFSSDGKNGMENYIMNTNTKEITKYDCIYNEKEVYLWNFHEIV